MQSMLSQSWAELLQTKLLTTATSPKRVVVIAGFFTNQVYDLFFLTLGHGQTRSVFLGLQVFYERGRQLLFAVLVSFCRSFTARIDGFFCFIITTVIGRCECWLLTLTDDTVVVANKLKNGTLSIIA